MISVPTEPEDPLAFRPDHFFLAPTRGCGVVRDRFGRIIDRCEVTTEGRWDHNHGDLNFDETFTYENGRTDILKWTFGPDAQGRLSATEAGASKVRGWPEGQEYRVRFKRPGVAPLDMTQLLYDARFTLVEPDMAFKTVRLKLLGVTLGVMTAYHRRAG